MPAYIAVFEVHARPDTSKPAVIVPAGKPLVCSADYAKDLLDMGAVRLPTADEIKIFGLKVSEAKEDAPAKKAPDAAKKAAEPAKAGGAKKSAEKPAEGAGDDTTAGGAGDDTTAGDDDGTSMV